MIIIRVSAYFLMLLQIPVFAQTDSLYTRDQLKEDLDIYRQALEEAHPRLYWYRTKSEIDTIFEAASVAVGTAMTERNFYSVLSSVTAKIGCLHTYVMAQENPLFKNGDWVSSKETRYKGRGTLPDYYIQTTMNDILQLKDPQLDLASKLIHDGQKD